MRRRAHLALRLSLLALASVPALTLVPRHPVNDGKVWTGLMLTLAALGAGCLLVSVSSSVWARVRPTLLPLLGLHGVIAVSLLVAGDLITALERWGEIAAWSALLPLAAAASGRRWLPRRSKW